VEPCTSPASTDGRLLYWNWLLLQDGGNSEAVECWIRTQTDSTQRYVFCTNCECTIKELQRITGRIMATAEPGGDPNLNCSDRPATHQIPFY